MKYEIVDVTPDNLGSYDLFCKKSKPKEAGYQNKIGWYNKRFDDGLRIKLLRVDEGKKDLVSRGFIEYVPAENGWRAINAPGYMLVHCIWVIGRNKKKGYGSELLSACIEDAKNLGKSGVVSVVSKGNWLPGIKLFNKFDFEIVDKAAPAFELSVMKFGDHPDPSFPTNWEERAAKFGKDLTVIKTSQCPYIEDATGNALGAAEELGIPAKVVELQSAKEVQEKSPTVYGIFNVVYDGKILSHYQLLKKEFVKYLEEARG